jgi:large subunit ribosomal protein L10Ae
LRDYNPEKDTRFQGSIKLDHAPYPNLRIAVLGNVKHVDEAKALGIDFLDQEGMKSFNKDKKKIKKWVKPYSILLASEELMKVTTKRMGR